MTAGAGASPFGIFPCGSAPTALVANDPVLLYGSRSVTTEGRYEVADGGGFEPMSDIDQCVRNLVLLGVAEAQGYAKFATDVGASRIRQTVAARLAPLVDRRDPKIRIKSMKVDANNPEGRMTVAVDYDDLTRKVTRTARASL